MQTINGCVVIDEHDIGKSKKTLLTDLLYESTRMRIPEDKIEYGKPQALDQRLDWHYDPNTFIPFKMDQNYNYLLAKGKGFMYRRRTLAEYFAQQEAFTIEIETFPFWTRDIVESLINPHLSYPLDPLDIVNYRFTSRDTTTLRLQAVPDSLLWAGTGDVQMDPLDPAFFMLVPNPWLPGFVQYGV